MHHTSITEKILTFIDRWSCGKALKKIRAHTGDRLRVDGCARIENSTMQHLIVNGAAIIKHSTTGDVVVNGALTATHATLGKIDINGSASLTQCIITGPIDCNGHVSLVASACSAPFTSKGALTATKSTIGSIQMRKMGWFHRSRILLIDSTIDGDVIFEDGRGIVVCKGSSTVRGTVRGGIIKQKSCS